MSQLLDLKNSETTEPQEVGTSDVKMPSVPEAPTPDTEEEFDAAELLAMPEEVAWQSAHPLPQHADFRRFLLMGGLVFAGGLVAWWQSSVLVFLVTVIGVAAWWIQEHHGQPASIRIDRMGMWIDGAHYPHAQLSSFDIHRLPDDTYTLSIKTSRWTTPHLHLPLGEQDPNELHAVLTQYVPEERHSVSLVEWWLRK